MGLINKILTRSYKGGNCIKDAALINPWYFNKNSPLLIKNDIKFSWKEKEKGISFLKNNNDVFGIFKMYAYVFPSKDNSKFLIWNRVINQELGFPIITLHLYNTADLKQITDANTEFKNLKTNKNKFFLLNAEPISEFTFALNENKNNTIINIPDEFNDFEEIFIVVDVPNLYLKGLPKWNNTALIIVDTKTKIANLYPQDWFNKSEANFCFQWLTTACRDPETNLVRTYGRRVESFLLSENFRDLNNPKDIKKI